jgi:hypothetical protein
MSRFIQSLESRTLFAASPVTKATLLADRAAILAEAKAARADLGALGATLNADTRVVQTDLRGSGASNAALFRTLRGDEGKTRATVNKDLNTLLGPTLGLANRTIGHGIALINHSSAAIDARITADLAALATAIAAPLAKLETDLQAPTIGTDLQAISSANATNTTLATDISKLEGDTSTAAATLTAGTTTFQGGIDTVSSDVAAAPPGPTGPGGSTIPNVVATYSGTATETSGTHAGRVSTLQMTFTSESATGAFSGTGTVTNPGQTANSFNVTGSVSANGTFTATFVDPTGQQHGATLTGHVSGNTISGTYQSNGTSGTFTASKP